VPSHDIRSRDLQLVNANVRARAITHYTPKRALHFNASSPTIL